MQDQSQIRSICSVASIKSVKFVFKQKSNNFFIYVFFLIVSSLDLVYVKNRDSDLQKNKHSYLARRHFKNDYKVACNRTKKAQVFKSSRIYSKINRSSVQLMYNIVIETKKIIIKDYMSSVQLNLRLSNQFYDFLLFKQ